MANDWNSTDTYDVTNRTRQIMYRTTAAMLDKVIPDAMGAPVVNASQAVEL